MKHDIFISYSRDDKALVIPFVEQISKAVNQDCWMDMKGIESGVEFEEVIMKAIDECQIVLFMLSDSSLKSPWTKREVIMLKVSKNASCPCSSMATSFAAGSSSISATLTTSASAQKSTKRS